MNVQFKIFLDNNSQEEKILRAKAKKVSFPLSKEIFDIAKQMKAYVDFGKDEKKRSKYKVIKSYGIAAPQLGHSLQMFYVSVPDSYNSLNVVPDSEEFFSIFLINPILISYQNQYCSFSNGESCLSVPVDRPGPIKRSVLIKIKGYSLDNKKNITLEAKGRMAIIIQHELDHLQGILYYDKIIKDKAELKNIRFWY